MEPKEDDPRFLKKRIADLERQLADQHVLVKLLASLPKPKANEPSEPVSRTPATNPKTRTRRARAQSEAGGGRVPEHPAPAAR